MTDEDELIFQDEETWQEARQRRLKVTLDQVGKASVVRFTRTDSRFGDVHLIVHRSTRNKGWQVSRVDRYGPSGHTDRKTFEDAVACAIGASSHHCGDDWGNDKYILNGMEGTR